MSCDSGADVRQVAPRLFCDICDVFDLHDTDDCPKQDMSNSPPASHHHGNRKEDRPYCTTCEGKTWFGPERIITGMVRTFSILNELNLNGSNVNGSNLNEMD